MNAPPQGPLCFLENRKCPCFCPLAALSPGAAPAGWGSRVPEEEWRCLLPFVTDERFTVKWDRGIRQRGKASDQKRRKEWVSTWAFNLVGYDLGRGLSLVAPIMTSLLSKWVERPNNLHGNTPEVPWGEESKGTPSQVLWWVHIFWFP